MLRRIGVDVGLVGCIHQLKLGNSKDMYTYNMQYSSVDSDVMNGIDISKY